MKRTLYSAIVIVFLLLCYYLVNNWDHFYSKQENSASAEKENLAIKNDFPIELLPKKGEEEWVNHQLFLIAYSDNHKQPLWTFHELKSNYTRGEANRYQLRFEEDHLLKGREVVWSDYSSTGFDRGHMVPAADFRCCDSLLAKTFLLTNIAPMDSAFNRHNWVDLEGRIRSYARRNGSVYVFTGPVFEQNPEAIGRYNKVTIPKYFYKIAIKYNKNKPQNSKVIAYLLQNRPEENLILSEKTVSINDIESLTGIDFFAGLSKDQQNILESRNNKSF